MWRSGATIAGKGGMRRSTDTSHSNVLTLHTGGCVGPNRGQRFFRSPPPARRCARCHVVSICLCVTLRAFNINCRLSETAGIYVSRGTRRSPLTQSTRAVAGARGPTQFNVLWLPYTEVTPRHFAKLDSSIGFSHTLSPISRLSLYVCPVAFSPRSSRPT